jgi:hypothetical protein
MRQLERPFLCTTIFGEAIAEFINDVGDDIVWGCKQLETCEIWWFRNEEIRVAKNITLGFNQQTPIMLSKERMKALAPHLKRYKR